MHLSALELGETVAKAALTSASIKPDQIDHIVFGKFYIFLLEDQLNYLGNVVQSVKDAAYLARGIGLRIGMPVEKPAITVNRLCGTGFESIVEAARVRSLNFHTQHTFLANYSWRKSCSISWWSRFNEPIFFNREKSAFRSPFRHQCRCNALIL